MKRLKTAASILKEKIQNLFYFLTRTKKHRIACSAVVILSVSAVFFELLPSLHLPGTLHLGVFSTSNWDVPQSATYELIDQVIEKFELQHPGMKVEYSSGIIKNDYSDWLSDQIVSGDTPDVFMILDEDFNMLASMGAMLNLGPNLQNDRLDLNSLFFENAAVAGQYNGVQYALPVECNIDLMFVNTDLLQNSGIELPSRDWTLDDLQAIAAEVTQDTDGDGIIDQFGLTDYDWVDMMEACEVDLFDPNGTKALIDTDEVWQALQRLKQLEPYCAESYPQEADNGFDGGKIAFVPMSYADYKTYQPYPWKVKKYSSFNWAVLPMPASTSEGKRSSLDSLLMGISSRTAHPQAAWELLKSFVFDEQNQEMRISLSSGISPLMNITSTVAEEKEEGLSNDLLGWALERTRPKIRFKKYEDAMNLLDTEIKQALNSEGDHDLILLELQNQVGSYLRN